MIITHIGARNEYQMGDIPIVRKFMDVFTEEVFGLPPKKEVKLFSDLVYGVGPMSMALHRISHARLVDLKNRIKEILEKKFT